MSIIYNGIVLPSSIDVEDWNSHGMRFTSKKGGVRGRRNARQPDLIVGHWTGGEGGAEQVFNALKGRKTRDKKGLSCHFFIDYQGRAFQFADLAQVTRHASAVNERSIGVEMQNRGFDVNRPRWNEKFPRAVYEEKMKGRVKRLTVFTSAQLVTWMGLCNALCEGLNIPKQVPSWTEVRNASGVVLRDTIPKKLNRSIQGVIGHYHVSRKYDPGTQPLELLIDHGYLPLVVPQHFS